MPGIQAKRQNEATFQTCTCVVAMPRPYLTPLARVGLRIARQFVCERVIEFKFLRVIPWMSAPTVRVPQIAGTPTWLCPLWLPRSWRRCTPEAAVRPFRAQLTDLTSSVPRSVLGTASAIGAAVAAIASARRRATGATVHRHGCLSPFRSNLRAICMGCAGEGLAAWYRSAMPLDAAVHRITA